VPQRNYDLLNQIIYFYPAWRIHCRQFAGPKVFPFGKILERLRSVFLKTTINRRMNRAVCPSLEVTLY
jgi:hypothetical protein